MWNLGNVNLFAKQFVIGCKETQLLFTKTETQEITSFHKWIDFKDSDWGMTKFKSSRTQNVSYLYEIPLDEFNDILEDLYRIYKKKRPHSKHEDFIEHSFATTISDLKKFIKWTDENSLTWNGTAPNETNYTYYYYFDNTIKEFLDFAIPENYDVHYFKQYFERVLECIERFENIITKEGHSTPEFLTQFFAKEILTYKKTQRKLQVTELSLEQIYKVSKVNNSVLSTEILQYTFDTIDKGRYSKREGFLLSDEFIDDREYENCERIVNIVFEYERTYYELNSILTPLFISSKQEVQALCELLITNLISELESISSLYNCEPYKHHCSDFLISIHDRILQILIRIKRNFHSLYVIDSIIPTLNISKTKNEKQSLITSTQKKVIDKLVNRGFKDVHIYRFLKDEKQFITITQTEFNIFMIDNYQRKYKPDKRITSITDISIPRELSMYFDEIKP